MLYYYDSVSDCADSDGGVGGVWLSECELGYNHNNNSSRKWMWKIGLNMTITGDLE